MSLEGLRFSYFFLCLVLGLIILSPTLAMVVKLPRGEGFTELWILGATHMLEDYPFNVSRDEVYSIYLGVDNHRGALESYVVYVKLRNQSEASLDSAVPSSVRRLFEYRVFLEDGRSWETQMRFSFANISFFDNRSFLRDLVINDSTFSVNKTALWNDENLGHYYQLLMELWLYNTTSGDLEYNRSTSIWLNMTR